MPNNYDYPNGEMLKHGILRITALAHSKEWFNLAEQSYREQKDIWYSELQKVALKILSPKQALASVPSKYNHNRHVHSRTVHKYTGHINGAIYGAPEKIKDGRTHLDTSLLLVQTKVFLASLARC